ncbi:MAG: hypothetical protein JWL73_622 [Actinomycetia bacterium]|nr:hypothetical protein [Actinomycetes bacterium]
MRKIPGRLAVVLGLVFALAVGGVAYAYFTTTGAGTGTATSGTSSALVLHGTTSTTLYPGTSSAVNFTVDNNSPGHQQLGTITLTSVSTDAAHSGCVTSDFTMPNVSVNQDLANGSGQAVTATGTISWANNGNQDACKGAPLTLNLTSN